MQPAVTHLTSKLVTLSATQYSWFVLHLEFKEAQICTCVCVYAQRRHFSATPLLNTNAINFMFWWYLRYPFPFPFPFQNPYPYHTLSHSRREMYVIISPGFWSLVCLFTPCFWLVYFGNLHAAPPVFGHNNKFALPASNHLTHFACQPSETFCFVRATGSNWAYGPPPP